MINRSLPYWWLKPLYFWRWHARFHCHLHFWIACQYCDDPMDNQGGAQ